MPLRLKRIQKMLILSIETIKLQFRKLCRVKVRFFYLDNFFFKNWFIKKSNLKGPIWLFLLSLQYSRRSLAFSGSRSRFWLLLMLQAIHHFRSNFFKRRYGSKITAPNYTQKIFPTTTHFWVITPAATGRPEPPSSTPLLRAI